MDIKLIFSTLCGVLLLETSYARPAQEGIEICNRLITALEKKEQTEEVVSAIKYVSKFKEQLAHERTIKIDENIKADLSEIDEERELEEAQEIEDSIVDNPKYKETNELIKEMMAQYDGL